MQKISFGTDGWRAIVADQFTVENVKLVGQAIADYTIEQNLQEQGIIVGHDTRFLGRMFAEEVVGVLAGNGIRSYLVNEATPTPVVAFGVKHFAASGAVMITASHHPSQYNGIRYIPDYAGPATKHITNRLEELIRLCQLEQRIKQLSLNEAANRKLMQHIFLRPHYEAHLRRMIHFPVMKQAGLNVVVDPMHGAGIGYLSSMLIEAGVKTTAIRESMDPLFGDDLPEPDEKHVTVLREEVRKQNALLGLANDGDGGRFGVVDRYGRFLPPNSVLALLAWHLLKNRRQDGQIVRTVATTHMLDRIAKRYGREIVETPVGFVHVGAKMREGCALVGGEESGCFSMAGHISEKDGLLGSLLLAEMCAWEGKPVDEILHELHAEFGQLFNTRLDIPLSEKCEWAAQLMRMPPRQVGPYTVKKAEQKDGVKLILEEDNWLLIRPSGTKQLLRIYGEASSAEGLEIIKEAVNDWLLDG